MDVHVSARIAPAREVRALIARAVVGADVAIPQQLGEITLRPHQRAAAARLASRIATHGGAMLAEPVGLGKTYTTLATAARFNERLLVAVPASLRSMWSAAIERARISARIITHEALSRNQRPAGDPSFVIVDEAHRLRTHSTKRYSALADICRRAKVLLVTATPVQNRRADLAAQLALYLGRVAWEMTDEQLAQHVVRSADAKARGQPSMDGPYRVALSVDDDCLDALLALPPPIPARDESLAVALQTYGLVHQWTSSRAALIASLTRRRSRGVALLAAVEAGRRPTRAELSAWTQAESAVQLAFPELVTANEPADVPLAEFAESIRRHDDSVANLIATLRATDDPDRHRAKALLEIRRNHPGERIIAFCQYAETVAALRSILVASPGIAALTARGARVAGGRISRDDVIARFDPQSAAHRENEAERIDLLITTDLLSEGVNLQEASVIVHLDLPWNPARLDQRVGRARRLGSRHDVVTVYSIAPPASAERVLRIEGRLRDKLAAAQRTVGIAGRILPSPLGRLESQPGRGLAEQNAAVADALSAWCEPNIAGGADDDTVVAATEATEPGFLALVRESDGVILIADIGRGIQLDAFAVQRAIDFSNRRDAGVDEARLNEILDRVGSWLAGRTAAASVDFRAAGTARARRIALARVARAVARAPRHQRARLAPLAAAARNVASAPMAEGAERVLELLVESDLPDEAWLRSIAAFGELNARPTRAPATSGEARVVAVILFGSSPT
jgi:superfamily II DNA or RNA helicase